MPATDLTQAERSTPRRRADRASADRGQVEAILDEALVAHVGFAVDGQPTVIPATPWRVGDRLCFHFAKASRVGEIMAAGTEVCVSVALVDGLVLARSAMHHSMNYRSVVLFGCAQAVADPAEKARLFSHLVDKLSPGRSQVVRPPTEAELGSTIVVALPIAEGAAKRRQGPPADKEADLARPVWAGVVPLALAAGPAQGDAHVPEGIAPPPTIVRGA
jgi:nitroimidazol reductase NimA-like FMN-containing flavoprotein (pyridoxamine 5'-phosphate oxidase superfamily)